jgi:dTDP-glucose 4,6-dehydratase
MKVLVTGGVDSSGSIIKLHIINSTEHDVLNIDKLTYTENLKVVVHCR